MNIQARVTKTKLRLFEEPNDSHAPLYKAHGTELLFGEIFEIEERAADGWVRGVSLTDGYKGWVNQSGLNAVNAVLNSYEEEYRVTIPIAPAYVAPNLKSHIKFHIPFEGRVFLQTPIEEQNGFIRIRDHNLWLHQHHICQCKDDVLKKISKEVLIEKIIDAAKLFLHCPYIYGGRTVFGIDCSALIQLAFAANKISLPRDTRPQAKAMANMPITDHVTIRQIDVTSDSVLSDLEKGDVIFFPGHVGLMIDDQYILHASSHLMQVVVQNIKDVHSYYLNREGLGIIAIRRICS